MTGVVIVNRKGVQMRSANGRYAPKIVPPAVAASVGPNSSRKTPGTNGIVPVDQPDRRSGPGVVPAQPAPPPGPNYRVVK